MALALLGLPMVANAAQTTWEIRGTSPFRRAPSWHPSSRATRSAFLVNFDRAAVPSATIGARARHSLQHPASSLSFDIFMVVSAPFKRTLARARRQRQHHPARQRLVPPLGDPAVDGYSFGLDELRSERWRSLYELAVGDAGAILDIVNGSGLAETPDARLATLADHAFPGMQVDRRQPGH
jgi:hypothetical protein